MSRHRRRPPIRLRRQWEREAAAWWADHQTPVTVAEGFFSSVEGIMIGPTTPDGRFFEVQIVGQDKDGLWIETKTMVANPETCPIHTFPRRP